MQDYSNALNSISDAIVRVIEALQQEREPVCKEIAAGLESHNIVIRKMMHKLHLHHSIYSLAHQHYLVQRQISNESQIDFDAVFESYRKQHPE